MASFSVPCPKCPSTSSSSLGLKSQLVPSQSGFSFKPFLSFSSLSTESASSRVQVSVFTSMYISISVSIHKRTRETEREFCCLWIFHFCLLSSLCFEDDTLCNRQKKNSISSLIVLMFCSIDFSCKWRNGTFVNDLRMTNYVTTREIFILWLFCSIDFL